MYRKTVEELQKDQREKLVIDIRSEQDYIKETYPGAKHIFWEEFMEHIGEIPKELPVYLFCYTGQRSDEIAAVNARWKTQLEKMEQELSALRMENAQLRQSSLPEQAEKES